MVYDLLGQCWWNTLYSRSYVGRSMVLVDVIMGVLTEPLSGLWTCRRSRSMIWAIGEDKIYGGHVGARILLYQMTSVSVSFQLCVPGVIYIHFKYVF